MLQGNQGNTWRRAEVDINSTSSRTYKVSTFARAGQSSAWYQACALTSYLHLLIGLGFNSSQLPSVIVMRGCKQCYLSRPKV